MKLNTQESFMLMAQHPEKGRFVISDIQLQYGLIGAILLDLSINGSIRIENNVIIPVVKAEGTNKINDEVLQTIIDSPKHRKINAWISRLTRKSRSIKWETLGNLELRNFFRIEHHKFLGIIPYRKCYLINKYARQELLTQLRNIILFQKEASSENLVLLGLIEACQMHKQLAGDKQELKVIKEKMKQIIKESPIAAGVSETIKQVQVAVTTAVISSTIAASVSTSH